METLKWFEDKLGTKKWPPCETRNMIWMSNTSWTRSSLHLNIPINVCMIMPIQDSDKELTVQKSQPYFDQWNSLKACC